MEDFELVYDMGINDVDTINRFRPNRVRKKCPVQKKWKTMLRECYSLGYKLPHWQDAPHTVCEEWLTFSNYERWLASQDYRGKVQTIRLFDPDNTVFDPDNTVFIDKGIHALIVPRKELPCMLPIGVNHVVTKHSLRYIASIGIKGKRKYLGTFDTQEQASTAYKNAKSGHIASIAREQTDEKVKQALLRHALLIRQN